MATNEENKRLELLTKYTNWIKKSKLKLLIVFIIYCTVLLLNFLFFKKTTAAGCARVKGILTPPYYIEYYPIITYKRLSKNE